MTYTINICPDAAAFLTLAEPFLLREDAAHNLILSIAGTVMRVRMLPRSVSGCSIAGGSFASCLPTLQTPPQTKSTRRLATVRCAMWTNTPFSPLSAPDTR